jgi:hypothetical protein
LRMPVKIVPYCADLVPRIANLNDRLAAGGSAVRFPTSNDHWLPKMPGRRVFTDYYLAVDEDETVRGAYILKQQDFSLAGQVATVGYFALPVSEGIVDRRYAPLGVNLLLDALQRRPLLHALGMGGYGEPAARLLKAAGWHMFSVPFFFRIVRPFSFLRNIAYLRRSRLRRLLLDGLAFSGAGWLSVNALNALHYRRPDPDPDVAVERLAEFGPWADDLWEACKAGYGMSAVRDMPTLQVLYPAEEEKFIRLRFRRGNATVGWAVLLDTQLAGHKQFGAMRLGSIVDCFASPSDAVPVIRHSAALLEQRGVDLIVSNQSHSAWCAAFHAAGFWRGPSNFIFAGSKKLTELLRSAGIADDELHWNRGDGDGPANL